MRDFYFALTSVPLTLSLTQDSTELSGEWGIFESSCVSGMVIESGLLLTD